MAYDKVYYKGQELDALYKGSTELYKRNVQPIQGKYLKFRVGDNDEKQAFISFSDPNSSGFSLEYSYDGNALGEWTVWDGSELEVKTSKALYIRGMNPNGLGDNRKFVLRNVDVTYLIIDGDLAGLQDYTIENIEGKSFAYLFSDFGSGNPFIDFYAKMKFSAVKEKVFQYMFANSGLKSFVSVIDVDSIPSYGCYNMFTNSTVMGINPKMLPAKQLGNSCYRRMFYNCQFLSYMPYLPADTVPMAGYREMFKYCPQLKTTDAVAGDSRLDAQHLNSSAYYMMFDGCSGLNKIVCTAPSSELRYQYVTNNWLRGVASEGTFTKAMGVEWTTGNSGIPTGWTVYSEDENPNTNIGDLGDYEI